MKCPICASRNQESIFSLNAGNFDTSRLYQTIVVVSCKECGHVFNKLRPKDINQLSEFYNQEYAPSNVSSKHLAGDRPGSTDSLSRARYKNLLQFMKPYVRTDSRILDGGCAAGGFLQFLTKKGFSKLYGIDISSVYAKTAARLTRAIVKQGSVESIPFGVHSFDCIVVDQVLEHLINPGVVFAEARRTLAPDGLLCISVPDAARYEEDYFFDYYWFLLREHVQHFDLQHLQMLAAQYGFELVAHSATKSPMMSRDMILPALNVVFRVRSTNVRAPAGRERYLLRRQLHSYIASNDKRHAQKVRALQQLAQMQAPLYVYGMSREFLYLYEAGLKKCKIAALVDDTPFKQKNYTVGGKPIRNRSILARASSDALVLITSFAHIAQMKRNLKEISYAGKVVSL